MPKIFKYMCNNCNGIFDLMIHPSDMIPYCTKCKSEDVTKQVSATRIGNTAPWKMAGQRLK